MSGDHESNGIYQTNGMDLEEENVPCVQQEDPYSSEEMVHSL